jgi:hypothetical protein
MEAALDGAMTGSELARTGLVASVSGPPASVTWKQQASNFPASHSSS